jgi:hypothetical protein
MTRTCWGRTRGNTPASLVTVSIASSSSCWGSGHVEGWKCARVPTKQTVAWASTRGGFRGGASLDIHSRLEWETPACNSSCRTLARVSHDQATRDDRMHMWCFPPGTGTSSQRSPSSRPTPISGVLRTYTCRGMCGQNTRGHRTQQAWPLSCR